MLKTEVGRLKKQAPGRISGEPCGVHSEDEKGVVFVSCLRPEIPRITHDTLFVR